MVRRADRVARTNRSRRGLTRRRPRASCLRAAEAGDIASISIPDRGTDRFLLPAPAQFTSIEPGEDARCSPPVSPFFQMLRRLIGPFREFGALGGTLYALHRGLPLLSPRLGLRYFEFMAQPITDAPLLPERMAKSIEWREIKPGDPEVQRMPAQPDIKQARFDQGAICLGTYRKGELIGYIWFCFRRYEEDEARCTFHVPAHDAVFDFDLYVFPAYRMGLGFLGIWHGASRYLRSLGVRCSFSRLNRFNVASRRAHDHLGWRPVGRAVFIRLWGAEVMAATIAPYLNVSFHPRDRVALRLHRRSIVGPDA